MPSKPRWLSSITLRYADLGRSKSVSGRRVWHVTRALVIQSRSRRARCLSSSPARSCARWSPTRARGFHRNTLHDANLGLGPGAVAGAVLVLGISQLLARSDDASLDPLPPTHTAPRGVAPCADRSLRSLRCSRPVPRVRGVSRQRQGYALCLTPCVESGQLRDPELRALPPRLRRQERERSGAALGPRRQGHVASRYRSQ